MLGVEGGGKLQEWQRRGGRGIEERWDMNREGKFFLDIFHNFNDSFYLHKERP